MRLLDKNIIDEYIIHKKTAKQIAEEYNISYNTLKIYLSKNGIKKDKGSNTYQNKDWLYTKYITENKSVREIAKELNIVSGIIYKWIDKHNIERKPVYIPATDLFKDKDWLYQKYYEEKLTIAKIAEEAKCNTCTILSWMDKFDLKRRTKGESRKLSYEFVKSKFEERGFTLLSTEYIDSSHKLEYLCERGHKTSICYADFYNGYGCKYCQYENNRRYFTEEELEKFKTYKRAVNYVTAINYKKYKYLINPENLKRSLYDYHLDHIYSMIDGFDNNIDVEIIGSVPNLRMVTSKYNLNKKGRSDMSKEVLIEKYNKFKHKEKGD